MNTLPRNPQEHLKAERREAEAIVLLHNHQATIYAALENSADPLARFTLTELKDFLHDGGH